MPALIDMTGEVFGRLRVTGRSVPSRPMHEARWRCLCDPGLGGCGTVVVVDGNDLRRGRTRSCGCLGSELTAQRNRARHAGLIPLFATAEAARRWMDVAFIAEVPSNGDPRFDLPRTLWARYRLLDDLFRPDGFRPDPAQHTRLLAAKELIPDLASDVCDWCRTEQPADQMMPVLFAITEDGTGMQCRDERACTKRQKAGR